MHRLQSCRTLGPVMLNFLEPGLCLDLQFPGELVFRFFCLSLFLIQVLDCALALLYVC